MKVRLWLVGRLLHMASKLVTTRGVPRTLVAVPVGNRVRLHIGEQYGEQLLSLASLDMKPSEFRKWCADTSARMGVVWPDSSDRD